MGVHCQGFELWAWPLDLAFGGFTLAKGFKFYFFIAYE